MKHPLARGVIALLFLALVLPLRGPCACPEDAGIGTEDCCPSSGGFDVALSSDDCCVTSAARPASAAEAAGRLQAPFVAFTMSLTVADGDAPIIAQKPVRSAPLPGIARPVPHLRI